MTNGTMRADLMAGPSMRRVLRTWPTCRYGLDAFFRRVPVRRRALWPLLQGRVAGPRSGPNGPAVKGLSARPTERCQDDADDSRDHRNT